jgi:hypothetical protein
MSGRLLVATVAAAAAVAAPAHAAQTFGSALAGDPQRNVCGAGQLCTYVQYSNLTPAYASPMDGVVVRWRVKASSSGSPVTLRVLRPAGAGFTGAGASAVALTTAAAEPDTFSTRLAIRAGDSIGLDNSTSALLFAQNGTPWVARVVPGGIPEGQTRSTDAGFDRPGYQLLVNADVEPDVDGDGYGDETQDGCPRDPARQTPPCAAGPANPGADPNPAPTISRLRLSRRVFRAGSTLPRSSGAGVGTTISWRLSEAARTTLTFAQRRAGRVRGGRCVLQTPRVTTGRRCVHHTTRGRLLSRGEAGLNRVRFAGRITRAGRLRPGSYRLTLVARDAAGNRSAARRTTFRLLAG